MSDARPGGPPQKEQRAPGQEGAPRSTTTTVKITQSTDPRDATPAQLELIRALRERGVPFNAIALELGPEWRASDVAAAMVRAALAAYAVRPRPKRGSR